MSDPRGQDTEALAFAGSLHNAFLVYTERVAKSRAARAWRSAPSLSGSREALASSNDAAGAHSPYGWMPYLQRLGQR